MNTYDVAIIMKVTKTYRVEAEDSYRATEAAHEIASVLPEEDIEEDYNQETVDCVLVCEGGLT